MLAIKLQRIGRKHQPSYRVVVAERRSKMAAPPVEDLGSYNSFTKAVTINKDRVQYWIGIGAQPTITAHNLFVKEGLISTGKRIVKTPKPAPKAPEASTPAVTETSTSSVDATAAIPAETDASTVVASGDPVVEAKEEGNGAV